MKRNKNRISKFLAAMLLVFSVFTSVFADASSEGKINIFSTNSVDSDGNVFIPNGGTLELNIDLVSSKIKNGEKIVVNVVNFPLDIEGLRKVADSRFIKSIDLNGDKLEIVISDSFQDNKPPVQFQIASKLELGNVKNAVERPISWSHGGDSGTIKVIQTPGGQTTPVTQNSVNKGIQDEWKVGQDLNTLISVDNDVLSWKSSPSAITIPYTVHVSSIEAISNYTLKDTISQYMLIDTASVTANTTVVDKYGYPLEASAKTVSVGGNGAEPTFTLDIPANSMTSVSYNASINPTKANDLLALLQTQYNTSKANLKNSDQGFMISQNLNNSVVNGKGVKSEKSLAISKTFENPNYEPPKKQPELKTSKQATTSAKRLVREMATGNPTLKDPFTIDYAINVDISEFKDAPLNASVFIEDELPQWGTWNPEVFSIKNGPTANKVTNYTTVSDFKLNSVPGDYAFINQTVVVNMGENFTNASVEVSATIDQLVLTNWNPDLTEYQNQAKVTYNNVIQSPSVSTQLPVITFTDGAAQDKSVFEKTTSSNGTTYLEAGKTALIPYTITFKNPNKTDLSKIVIVDTFDSNTFNVTKESVLKNLNVKFGYWLSDDDQKTLNKNLMVDVVDNTITFKFNANLTQEFSNKQSLNDFVTINYSLETFVIRDKQTIQLKNSARISSAAIDNDYFDASYAKSSSYGAEIQWDKNIWDINKQETTKNLKLSTDAASKTDRFVNYRIDAIRHKDYIINTISTIVDKLSNDVEFAGFIDSFGQPIGDTAITVASGVKVSYEPSKHTVEISKNAASGNYRNDFSIFFKVKIKDNVQLKEGYQLVNALVDSKTTLTVTDSYVLDLYKANSDDLETVISDQNARFTVLTMDDQTVIENIYVLNNRLVQENGTPVTVSKPGSYKVIETIAPKGYEKTNVVTIVSVGNSGVSDPVTIYNKPASGITTPVDPTPVDPTPVDPTPVDPTPVDPTPVDPTPVDPTPVDPTPVDPTPVDPTPVDPTPVDPTPVDPTPVDPTPVDPTPVDPTPVDPTPVDPTPVDPTPVDPTPVDPTPVDPTPVDPTPVDPDKPVTPVGQVKPVTPGTPEVALPATGIASVRLDIALVFILSGLAVLAIQIKRKN